MNLPLWISCPLVSRCFLGDLFSLFSRYPFTLPVTYVLNGFKGSQSRHLDHQGCLQKAVDPSWGPERERRTLTNFFSFPLEGAST